MKNLIHDSIRCKLQSILKNCKAILTGLLRFFTTKVAKSAKQVIMDGMGQQTVHG
jgi:hypothetical protein